MISRGSMWLRIWGVLLTVFALGAVTGAAISGLYRTRAGADQLLSSMRGAESHFDTLKRELNLSPEQSSEMRVILDEMRNEYKTVCAEVRPRYYALRENARTRMRALLSEDQRQRFDSIITEEDCKCPEQK